MTYRKAPYMCSVKLFLSVQQSYFDDTCNHILKHTHTHVFPKKETFFTGVRVPNPVLPFTHETKNTNSLPV